MSGWLWWEALQLQLLLNATLVKLLGARGQRRGPRPEPRRRLLALPASCVRRRYTGRPKTHGGKNQARIRTSTYLTSKKEILDPAGRSMRR